MSETGSKESAVTEEGKMSGEGRIGVIGWYVKLMAAGSQFKVLKVVRF